jgi:ADP-ribose pyrophosphatase YjhB (NUDIX family)
LIEHDRWLLLIREKATDRWFLPGGTMTAGEPAELALRRSVLDQVGLGLAEVRYFATVENGNAADGVERHEVHIVFTAIAPRVENVITGAEGFEARWMWWGDLDSVVLCPPALAQGLSDGSFDAGSRWRPWQVGSAGSPA